MLIFGLPGSIRSRLQEPRSWNSNSKIPAARCDLPLPLTACMLPAYESAHRSRVTIVEIIRLALGVVCGCPPALDSIAENTHSPDKQTCKEASQRKEQTQSPSHDQPATDSRDRDDHQRDDQPHEQNCAPQPVVGQGLPAATKGADWSSASRSRRF